MNIKKLLVITLLTALTICCFNSCAPRNAGSASSHIHTESEHNHNGGTDNNNSSKGDDKNTSSKTSAGVQRPDKNDKVDKDKIEKLPELSEQGQNTSKKLLEDIEKLNPKALNFFRVKNTTYASTSYVAFNTLNKNLNSFKTVKDKDTIRHIKDALEHSTWTAKKFTSNTTPNIVIYFDDKMHLNIENEVDGVFWMSLNADYGKVYYIVPENVYENVMAFCYELEK